MMGMPPRIHGFVSSRLLALVAAKVTVVLLLGWYRRRQNRDEHQELFDKVPPKSILDFEKAALSKKFKALAKLYVQYFSDQAVTMTAGRLFFDSIRLLPMILTGDVSKIDTTLKMFGQVMDLPVLVAPSAFHVLVTPEGEVATARGSGKAGAGYCYNWMLSSKVYTDVLEEPGVKWLHIYMFEEEDLVKSSIKAAEGTGQFSAIILTCDHPHTRVQNRMIPYFSQAEFPYSNMDDYFFPNQAAMGFDQTTIRQLLSGRGTPPPSREPQNGPGGTNSSKLSWDNVKWIKSLTKLPIVCKGILSPSDARAAVAAGADAIVVSNHGGRQCDFAPPAIEALPAVVVAVAGKIPVLVDTGIRTSNDILKALCLGASGVLLGRPALWALACEGSRGLQRMLDTLRQDLQDDLRSLGVTSIQELNISRLWPPDRQRILDLIKACGEEIKSL